MIKYIYHAFVFNMLITDITDRNRNMFANAKDNVLYWSSLGPMHALYGFCIDITTANIKNIIIPLFITLLIIDIVSYPVAIKVHVDSIASIDAIAILTNESVSISTSILNIFLHINDIAQAIIAADIIANNGINTGCLIIEDNINPAMRDIRADAVSIYIIEGIPVPKLYLPMYLKVLVPSMTERAAAIMENIPP